jgi:hypothetical protein
MPDIVPGHLKVGRLSAGTTIPPLYPPLVACTDPSSKSEPYNRIWKFIKVLIEFPFLMISMLHIVLPFTT